MLRLSVVLSAQCMCEVGREAYGERLATCVTLWSPRSVWVRCGGRRTANALPHVLRLSVVLFAQCMGEVGREAYGERLATCVTSKRCVVCAVYG